ncbi:MAG: A24 family peptidase [Pseudomonadota bacterium]
MPIVLISLALMIVLALVSEIDMRIQSIPDVLSLGLLVGGLCIVSLMSSALLIPHFLAAGAGLLFFAALSYIYYKWRGRYGLGLGDAKLFGAAGAWVGLLGLPSVLLWATLSALGVVVLRVMFDKTFATTQRIAFGPYLAFGLWIVWLFGSLQ